MANIGFVDDNQRHVVTLLMDLVLDQDKTMRVHPVDILRQKVTHNRLPRMLETDLAAQAFDVLDVPIVVTNSTPAKRVLRTSMHVGLHPSRNIKSKADVFGVPLESGWSIPKPELAHNLGDLVRSLHELGTFSLRNLPITNNRHRTPAWEHKDRHSHGPD